jgi:hypothetical protein
MMLKRKRIVFIAERPDEVSLLTSGAEGAQAGCVTKVPQVWVFGLWAR